MVAAVPGCEWVCQREQVPSASVIAEAASWLFTLKSRVRCTKMLLLRSGI